MRYQYLSWDEVEPGQDLTVWWKEPNGAGQGGIVRKVGPIALSLDLPLGDTLTVWKSQVDELSIEVAIPLDECIEYDPDFCEGVADHRSVDGFGSAPVRCDYHWALRLERRENSLEKYANSDLPPAWFDPAYAGERWAEDDY